MEIIYTSEAPAPVGPYSQAVKAGDFLFIAGQIPIDPSTNAFVEGGVAEQTKMVLQNLSKIVEAAGGSLKNIVKTTVFMTDLSKFSEMNDVYATFFTENPPARAAIEVKKLPKNALVEIQAIAYLA
ncbi:RidA family protein [bacterium]|nr:RidA family protein [bacterium]